MKLLAFPALLCFVSLSLSFGCANVERQTVKSSSEIQELADFIVIGETTREEVLEKLGSPASVPDEEDGSNLNIYEWETGSANETSSSLAYLFLLYDPEGVVVSKLVQGPEKS